MDERRKKNILSDHMIALIAFVISCITSICIISGTWNSLKEGVARADSMESKNSITRQQSALNTEAIKSLSKVTNDTNEKLDKFIDRYNSNREQDQRVLRQILIAVKNR